MRSSEQQRQQQQQHQIARLELNPSQIPESQPERLDEPNPSQIPQSQPEMGALLSACRCQPEDEEEEEEDVHVTERWVCESTIVKRQWNVDSPWECYSCGATWRRQ